MAMPSSQQIKASPVEMPVDVFKAAIEGNSDLLLRLLGLQPELEQTEIQVIEAAWPASLITSQQIEDDQHTLWDILESVTHFGDTLLHLLVTKKHNKLALIVFLRDRPLLKVRNKDFETPLHCAAKVGNDEVIRNLIQLDREFVMESVRETNSNKDTALHVAAKHGHEGVAEELMKLDPRVAYMVNKEEFSPLYLATVGGYTNTVKKMLNSDSSLACQEYSNGMFPVHVAAQVGNKELVEHFIENYPDDAELLDRRGWNLFHFAAHENKWQLIRQLINRFSMGLVNATDYEGNTPLHVATMKGHASVMRTICIALPRSDTAVQNNQGLTPFNLPMNKKMRKASEIKASPVEMPVDVFKAAITGNSNVLLPRLGLQPELEQTEIQVTIDATSPTSQQIEADDQHADRDILGSVTHFGETLLHLLVTKKHNELALIVFQSDKSLLKARNKDFETPLHCAAKVGNHEVIRDLIQLDREFVMDSVRETNSNKDTALHVAAKHAHEGVVDELMMLDPHVAYMVNKEEFSPLYLAIVGGYTNMVKNMLNSDSSLACQEFSNGMFPVHVAAQVGNRELVEHFIEDYPDDAELLDRRGWNLFHFAAEENNWSLIEELKRPPIWALCSGLINAKDYEGNTPLHVATMKGHVSVMRGIFRALDRSEMEVQNNQGLRAFDLSMNQIRAKPSEGLQHKILSYVSRKRFKFSSEWFGEIMESDDDTNKWERVQVIGLGSVLITTVTFAAAFAIPGGYNQDRGTPILGRKYMFKAFILANTQSFIQAFMSLLTLVLNARHNLSTNDLRYATYTFIAAAGCMVLAFGLGSYVILAPVSLPIAIVVLVYSLLLGSPFMYKAIEINKFFVGGNDKFNIIERALYKFMLFTGMRFLFTALNLDKMVAWRILGVSVLGIFLIALA